ncbi:GDYXXLXY domain-containing protein [Campylobacter mucosalis]|uniref:GDYXXLXY domain-containing protein n=1 Tax=Campylobacter mucosalis TaxID=202 RepID=UPI0014701A32|nr:GDYXXLXY domain-containing protein [Campylobacter mucosalis]
MIKFLAIFIQPLLLVGFFIYAILPLYLGKDVYVKTKGYDPRDFFRGNYVYLRYDFNDMKISADDTKLTDIYAVLEPNKDGIYETISINKTRPNAGVYISGKRYDYIQNFGIEKYFLPLEKALELEKTLRDIDSNITAIAHLKIFNGDARLIDVKIATQE